jgi:N6-L-threonylcarbamoyladenine synthase
MKILSIETSCDETGLSVLEQKEHGGEIVLLGNALASQIALHAQYGGVFPAMAKRAHAEKIVPLLKAACTDAQLLRAEGSNLGTENKDHILATCTHEDEMVQNFVELFNTYEKPDIDYIAVTVGPGLEPALWVGINAAKVLSTVWSIPVIPVNHMEGHVVTAAVTEVDKKIYTFRDLEFPLLALLVSGGHTELVLTKSYGDYEKIGQTRDDAVGEAFDKVARMIGLPYPGGPAVSKLAKEFRASSSASPSSRATADEAGSSNTFVLPRPMLHSGDYDFSFSGLKTAMLYTIRDLTRSTDGNTIESVSGPAADARELTKEEKSALACAFEDAAIEVLIKKTLRAAEEFHTQTIVVGGGVAGNSYLREQLLSHLATRSLGIVALFPEQWLATDNAVMIGLAAFARFSTVGPEKENSNSLTRDALTLKANGNLSIAN